MARSRMVVVGVDGATWERLDVLMAADVMPELAAMCSAGVRGDLESVLPPVTAPAWASFMTGAAPGRHGVYEFVYHDPESYAVRPVNGNDVDQRTLWQQLSEHGRRSVVLNVPMTWPPRPIDGVLISDFLLAPSEGPLCSPPGALAELEARLGPYPTEIVPPFFLATHGDADIAVYVQAYRDALSYKLRAAAMLLDRYDPDLLVLHLFGNDQISHWLWEILDPEHPHHEPRRAERHRESILAYYRELDAGIAGLRSAAGDNANTLVLSDHGFGPVYRSVDLNAWLLREGYLALRRGAGTRLRHRLWQWGLAPAVLAQSRLLRPLQWLVGKAAAAWMGRSGAGRLTAAENLQPVHRAARFMLSFADVDWPRTRAFAPFGQGQIHLHTRGRWSHGQVEPGAEATALREEIVAGLRQLTDPATGEPLPVTIHTRDAWQGPRAQMAPDILLIPDKGIYQIRSTGFASNRVVGPLLGMTGTHKMNGLLLGIGPDLASGREVEGARLIDVCPTILRLLDVPIPDETDGRVLEEIVATPTAATIGSAVAAADEPVDGTLDGDDPRGSATDEESERAVLERLRSLGYLS